ncbi:polysaccharide biosynthesis tyrosine autokinase [Ruminococcus flavefaciens]|uniref:non-specific protein-tyrosine kinase n=1 Tax=Ruminococcus flavefaciens TaxID=1265 RepID=A0A315Y4F9_RUMFL|nr:polysaccharide biosynthesis tyrosine autokinase [Ruminococcus flavefaciens]PWJ14679.1 capsular exopolysaccharide synthesis family protein [Ruminococcus flavefaciens]SSA42709.1 capsular exopolysaccharide family [Ruminococcus flavefaciens]
MNQSYSIKDIIRLLLSHIWLIIVITVLGAGAAFGISKFLLPLQYSSHITMYVQSYTGITENANSANNISNSKQLVNTYMEVLKDDAVMNAVAEKLSKQFEENVLSQNFTINDSGKITPASIRSCLAISSVTDTSAVKVNATAKNAEVAAAICNDLTQVAPQYVEEAVGVGSINTIDTAKVYNTPVAPNIMKNTMIGAVAGFMLIVLIIFLIDFFDNTIKDTDALGKKYNKAIIGDIQAFGDSKKKRDADDVHLKLTDKDAPFYIIESYKSIRTNLSFALSTVEKKTFVVSSANPGEGKSTTSANIAIAIAQSGSHVLLIDADMRKSVQHKIFELVNKKGLSTAVSKMHTPDECIQKNVMENLDVMTAGPIPPNPSELLASEMMEQMLNELSEKYDAILIDTPPVNVVTDAMELAKSVSGIVLVVRYGRTTDEDVDNVFKRVELANMNLLGFILNGVKSKHAGYYSKYGKGKYYGYYGAKPELDTVEAKAETQGKD